MMTHAIAQVTAKHVVQLVDQTFQRFTSYLNEEGGKNTFKVVSYTAVQFIWNASHSPPYITTYISDIL